MIAIVDVEVVKPVMTVKDALDALNIMIMILVVMEATGLLVAGQGTVNHISSAFEGGLIERGGGGVLNREGGA